MDKLIPPEEDFFMDPWVAQEEEPPVPFVGLRNLGNSCFFNSVLQVLFYCPRFQKYLEKYKEQVGKMLPDDDEMIESSQDDGSKMAESDKNKCKLFSELQNLFLRMREKQLYIAEKGLEGEKFITTAAEPRNLLNVLREVYPDFEPFTQQDAEECLRCMLGALHDAVSLSKGMQNCTRSDREPIVSGKIFGGSKGAETAVAEKFSHQSENQDPMLARKESKTTAFRKRGLKILFKNPLKRGFQNDFSQNHLKKNKTMNPLTENKDHNKQSMKKWPLSHKLVKKRKTASLLDGKADLGLAEGLKGLYTPDTLPNFSDGCDEYVDFDAPKGTIKLPKVTKKPFVEPENHFLHEESGDSFIQGLFRGELISEIRCMECEKCAERVEEFMDISLPVRQDTSDLLNTQEEDLFTLYGRDDANQQNHLRCTVTWGLSAFTSHEILEGDNKYNCGNCHRYTEGERRLLLHKLPSVLTLHLKRFSSGGTKGGLDFGPSVSKINTCFDVPLELTLERWCSKSCQNGAKYKLFGVVVHSGSTVCSGHYLAYVRFLNSPVSVDQEEGPAADKIREYDNQWLEADDDTVKVISNEKLKEVISPSSADGTRRTPYLLFYYRDV